MQALYKELRRDTYATTFTATTTKKPSIYRKTVLEMEALLIASHALPQRLLHSSCAKYLLLVESRYDVAVTTVSKFVRRWKVLGFSCTHTHTHRKTYRRPGRKNVYLAMSWVCKNWLTYFQFYGGFGPPATARLQLGHRSSEHSPEISFSQRYHDTWLPTIIRVNNFRDRLITHTSKQ